LIWLHKIYWRKTETKLPFLRLGFNSGYFFINHFLYLSGRKLPNECGCFLNVTIHNFSLYFHLFLIKSNYVMSFKLLLYFRFCLRVNNHFIFTIIIFLKIIFFCKLKIFFSHLTHNDTIIAHVCSNLLGFTDCAKVILCIEC